MSSSNGSRGGGRGGARGGGRPGGDRHTLEQKGNDQLATAARLEAAGDLRGALAASNSSVNEYSDSRRARQDDGMRVTGATRSTLSAHQDARHQDASRHINRALAVAVEQHNELQAQVTLAPPRASTVYSMIAHELPASAPVSAWGQRAAAQAPVTSPAEAFPPLGATARADSPPPRAASAATAPSGAWGAGSTPSSVTTPLAPRFGGRGQLLPLGQGAGRPMVQRPGSTPAAPAAQSQAPGRGRGRR